MLQLCHPTGLNNKYQSTTKPFRASFGETGILHKKKARDKPTLFYLDYFKSSLIAEQLELATVNSAIAEHFFNAQQLVVFTDTISPAG
jgi:hypothetical protein